MGGRPWTSRGCISCRKRKTKCDEEKPECGKCKKKGLKCPGYDQYRNWVNGSSTRALFRLERDNPSSVVYAASGSSSPISPISPILPDIYSKQPMREQIHSFYVNFHLPTGEKFSDVNMEAFIQVGIGLLPQKGELIEKAITALACLFLGKKNNHHRLVSHGIRLYNEAICIMTRLINRNIYTDEILYAAFTFQELAASYSPSGMKSWHTHISGLNAILRHFSKKASSNPLVDAIKSHQQKLSIVTVSKGMDLSKEEYELVMEPTGGNPMLEILQITVAIGKLQETMNSIDFSSSTACQKLLSQCNAIKTRLINLQRSGKLGETPSECSSAQFLGRPGVQPPSTERLFGLAYLFSSADHAMLYIMLWTQFVYLQPLIYRAQYIVDAHINPSSAAHQTDHYEWLLAELYANEIARAIPYCFQRSLKTICTQLMTHGTGAISSLFIESQNREKFEWCLDVYQQVANIGFEPILQLVELLKARWENRASARKESGELSIRRQVA
ncbi:hypothetical protein N7456_002349 [Penicillium angulare]|uniref:Zn(2)-C6 fungal-type domain-containing protein n=1 Tax=Penicillium angulare TaxID=116970 RepID=A0A9W9G7X7_9EURO|nr:hypothetical protein N7456_002349 [Penicillium angulare]